MGVPAIEGYTDLVEIGRGGFGTVYRAFETSFERHVAIKVIQGAHPDEATMARFERECRATGVLSGHPNIVGAHAAGRTDDGMPYLVMDYLAGGSVADQVRRDGPAAPGAVAELGIALAGALETAHRANVVHRDIKPENILYSSFGTPKLVDFGIARMQSAYETRTGSVSATLMHAAPEIVAGASASPASDIFSLASVLYYMLVGHAPHWRPGEESLAPLLARIATGNAPSLTGFGVPEPLAVAIGGALATQPADRPGSAAAFGEQLRDAAVAMGNDAAVPVAPVVLDFDAAAVAAAAEGGTEGAAEGAAAGTEGATTGQVARDRLEPVVETVVPVHDFGRRRLLAAAAVVGLVAAGGGIAFAVTRSGGQQPAKAATAITSPAAARSSSSAVASSMSSTGSAPKTTPSSKIKKVHNAGAASAGAAGAGAAAGGAAGPAGTAVAQPGPVLTSAPTVGPPAGGTVSSTHSAPRTHSPAPTTSAPSKKTTTAPGTPGSGSARWVSTNNQNSPTLDTVSVSWGASSGSPSEYKLRYQLVQYDSGTTTTRSVTTTASTSVTVTVAADNTADSYYKWQVAAVNSAGNSSGWRTLAAGISNQMGRSGIAAAQMLRAAGAVPAFDKDAGTKQAPSADKAWTVYEQSIRSGTVAPGTLVSLSYYGDA